MKFLVNDKVVFELSETQVKVIQDNVFSEEFEKIMGERVKWVIERKFLDSLKHLKDEWVPKLKQAGAESIPLDDEKFAELVFSQKDYKARADRDKPLPKKITQS